MNYPLDNYELISDSGSVAVDSFAVIAQTIGQDLPVDTVRIVVDSGLVVIDGFYEVGPVLEPWEDGPSLVPVYAGQNQQQKIQVPASIAYRQPPYGQEEGPWVMLPYASLYPPGSQTEGTDPCVPPPVKQIDIFTAQQTWPL